MDVGPDRTGTFGPTERGEAGGGFRKEMPRRRRWKVKEWSASGSPPAEASTLARDGARSPEGDSYSVAETARALGLSTRRIRQLIEEGKLQAKRTTLGAFHVPVEQVFEEQRRRTDASKLQPGSRGPIEPSGPPAHGPVPRKVRVSAEDHGLEADRGDRARKPSATLVLGRPSGRLLGAVAAVALTAGIILGVALGTHLTPTGRGGARSPASSGEASAQRVVLLIDPPPLHGLRKPEGRVVDAFVPSDFTVRAGIPVQLTVFNYGDTPHTFTSSSLGVDVLIPPALQAGPSSVTVSFTPKRLGSFRWRCRVQCDPWSMTRQGYMRGTVTVVAA
jgi:hypothetical protein